ncbi:MAG: hypothetical protein Q9184_001605 [Pyrenodesmia sp. 2 TL-2023]
MGQEASTPINETTPPQTLNARTLEAVAAYIKGGRARKGLLLKLFTQNIDCLERKAGVPDDKIVEAHGSFASQRCIECQTDFPDDLMKQAISRREVPYCRQAPCKGLVKPNIVFFGESLPEEFQRNRTLPAAADLAIIMGTSLTVQPFASLPGYCSEGVPRLLVNSERVGGLGSRADDVLLLGDCDEGVRKLASAVGWLEELEALFETHHPKQSSHAQSKVSKTQDDRLEDEIAKITEDVDVALRISSQHTTDLPKSPSLPEHRATEALSISDKENVQSQPGTGHNIPPEMHHAKSDQSSQRERSEEHPFEGEGSDEQRRETTASESQAQPLESDRSKSSL